MPLARAAALVDDCLGVQLDLQLVYFFNVGLKLVSSRTWYKK